jgi:hypothetical protein
MKHFSHKQVLTTTLLLFLVGSFSFAQKANTIRVSKVVKYSGSTTVYADFEKPTPITVLVRDTVPVIVYIRDTVRIKDVVRDTIRITNTIVIRDTLRLRDTVFITPIETSNKLRATTTPFTVYLQWDSIAGAKEYSIYKNGKLETVINGLDTWILQDPGSTSTYTLNNGNSITVTTPPAPITAGRMVGDRKELKNITVKDGIVTGVTFVTADIGKQISLEGARSAKWYREAPLWGHGTITGPNTVSGLDNCVNSIGYYGTNNYRNWLAELADSTPRQIVLTGSYIIRPPANLDRSTGPPLKNKALSIVGGTICFGAEDAIGTELNHPPPPYYFSPAPLVAIQHIGGTLVINSTILGPSNRQLNNREPYPVSIFYRAESNANPKQVFISGIFGDTANYLNGFFQGFRMQGPTVAGGKSVLAFINCQIANQELATVGVSGAAPEIGIYDKSYRFILRNTVINGSGRNTATLPLLGQLERYNDKYAMLSVDSLQYPTFTFMNLAYWEENPSTRNLLMKLPNADAGVLNAFTNIVWRPGIVPLSPYSALVPIEPSAQANEHLRQRPLPYGPVMFNTATQMHPSIGIEGHVLYQNTIEIEGYNSTVKNCNNAFIRMNGADGLKGSYKQWSLVNVTYIPPPVKSPWFEPMRKMGYYLQYSTSQAPPLVQFQPMGFVGERLIK